MTVTRAQDEWVRSGAADSRSKLNGLVHHDRWHMEDARRAIEGEAEQPFGDAAFQHMLRGGP